MPKDATPLQRTLAQTNRSFDQQVEAQVGHLIVALYQKKLTYGEFAQKRYEIDRDGDAAKLQFQKATLLEDQERQAKAKQLAQEQFNKNLAVWAAYNQSIARRQPQSVHCTSTRNGNYVSTNCN